MEASLSASPSGSSRNAHGRKLLSWGIREEQILPTEPVGFRCPDRSGIQVDLKHMLPRSRLEKSCHRRKGCRELLVHPSSRPTCRRNVQYLQGLSPLSWRLLSPVPRLLHSLLSSPQPLLTQFFPSLVLAALYSSLLSSSVSSGLSASQRESLAFYRRHQPMTVPVCLLPVC